VTRIALRDLKGVRRGVVEPAPLTLPAGPLWQRRDKHTRGDNARPRLPRYAARATSPRRAVEDKAGAEQPGLDHLIYGYSATDAVQARVAFWRTRIVAVVGYVEEASGAS